MKTFAYALGFLVLPVVAYRLYLGIDFTDESYYLAVALRFIRGDTPFVDELFINQSAILVVLPFYRVIYAWYGTDGLVLHARFLYFAFTLLIAAAAYLALCPRAGKLNAFLASLVAVAFIPLNIPALSYNTLGGGFFAIGLFMNARRLHPFGVGIALGLAVFSYPPLVIAEAIALVVFFARATRRRYFALSLAAAHATVLLAFFPYFARAGDAMGQSLLYSLTAFDHGGGWRKWFLVGRDIFVLNAVPRALAGIAAILGGRVLRDRAPVAAGALLIAAFPLLYLGFAHEIFPSIWAVTYLALGALTLRWVDRDVFIDILFPSILAGFLTAWTSMSSVANAVIGMWAAAIAASSLLGTAAARLTRRPFAGPTLQLLALACLISALFHGKVFYCDGEYGRLTARIRTGPFRDLFTTPAKKAFLDQVTHDVTVLENPGGRVIFYEFPAGYLLTRMKSGAPESWIRTVSRRKDFYVRYYRAHLSGRNLVFAFNFLDDGYPSPVTYDAKDPLIALVRETHVPIVRRHDYVVLAPRS